MKKRDIIQFSKYLLIYLVLLLWFTIGILLIHFQLPIVHIYVLLYVFLFILAFSLINITDVLYFGGVLLVFLSILIIIQIVSMIDIFYQIYYYIVLAGSYIFYILIIYFFMKLLGEKQSNELSMGKLNEEYNMLRSEHEENTARQKRLKLELERMKKLSHTAFILGTTMEEPALYDYLVKETADILMVKKVILSKYIKDKGRFCVVSQIGYNESVLNKPTDNLDMWIRETKLPVLIDNTSLETKIKIKRFSDFSNDLSIIAVPIIVADTVYCVLRSEDSKPDFFSNDELRVLDYISDLGSIIFENLYYFKEVERLAITDGITGLFVHKYMLERLENEVERFEQNEIPVSLIMFDIDNFKQFNDNYGHTFGDQILIAVSKIIEQTIRETDFPVRYGGDEFAIILPQTGIKGAIALAERLYQRVKIIDLSLLANSSEIRESITISVGVGTYKKVYQGYNNFLSKVDSALYNAKNKGKNRIEAVSVKTVSHKDNYE